MVGLLELADVDSIEPTMSVAEAKIFSSALNHDYYEEMKGEDKFPHARRVQEIFNGNS